MAGQASRLATATTPAVPTIVRIEKTAMTLVLHDEPAFSPLPLAYVLSRNLRIDADLADQLLNSSEMRLARVLLLGRIGKEHKPEPALANNSQETLAEIIGTTRSRVRFSVNKFRKLGFIEYNGGLTVPSFLLDIVFRD